MLWFIDFLLVCFVFSQWMETGLPGLHGIPVQKPVVMDFKSACVTVQIQRPRMVEDLAMAFPWKPRYAV